MGNLRSEATSSESVPNARFDRHADQEGSEKRTVRATLAPAKSANARKKRMAARSGQRGRIVKKGSIGLFDSEWTSPGNLNANYARFGSAPLKVWVHRLKLSGTDVLSKLSPSHLAWLNSRIGDAPLAAINNRALANLVSAMHEAGFKPKTMVNYLQVVKAVVASLVNDEGEPVFPRKWNHEFIDLPTVNEQHQPTLSKEEIEPLIHKAHGRYRDLFCLLAGTGGWRGSRTRRWRRGCFADLAEPLQTEAWATEDQRRNPRRRFGSRAG
jgi:hypothetical protein